MPQPIKISMESKNENIHAQKACVVIVMCRQDNGKYSSLPLILCINCCLDLDNLSHLMHYFIILIIWEHAINLVSSWSSELTFLNKLHFFSSDVALMQKYD